MTEWKRLVEEAFVRQKRGAASIGDPQPAPPPAGSTELEICQAESRCGVVMDSEYRAFLRSCNGWDGFGDDWYLYNASELGAQGVWADGDALLVEYLASEQDGKLVAPQGTRLLLVGVSKFSARFLVAVFSTTPAQDPVRYFDCQSGTDIGYSSFEMWMVEQIDYI
ncbi:SMI1/KNR4 family protein [Nocardia sp. NPDC058114]|uniref:SMI1/KNR4 family protein n=1 Tax=Nocardia sp. NPDC058114 TaxID=3346346 RepID=UPI0036DD2A3F